VDTVAEAINSGVIATAEDRLRFRHDLIRQVLVEQTPATVRAEIHRQAARTLADAGHGADVVARHLLATPVFDDWALTWLAEASESSLHAAPQAYESMLLRAYDSLHIHDPRWEALASRLAQTQLWLGRHESAEQTGTAVLRRTDDKELAGRMSVLAVRAAGRQNQLERAHSLVEEALADPGMPPHWQARLRPWKAMVLLMLGRAGEAKVIANEALSAAWQCHDQLGIGYAYHALLLADPSQRRTLGGAAMENLGDDTESAHLRLTLLLDHLEILVEAGATAEADALMADALVMVERFGPATGSIVLEWAADIHYDRGDWDEALRYIAMIPPEGYHGHNPQVIAAEIALRRDQRDRAHAHLRAAGLPDQPGGPGDADITAQLTVPLAIRAQADGDLRRAFALAKYLLDHPVALVMARTFGPDLVRVALELGEIPTARAAAAWVTNSPFPELAGVRICQALIDDDTDALLSAAEEYRRRGWRNYRAFALEEAAVRLARAGQSEQARAAHIDAVQLYTDFGATMDIRRADSRLRNHGIRRGPRSVRHRPTHGWQALTPSELRIAKLVAEGLSNPDIAARLYVSRGTVQTHVSSILAKLAMTSRIDLIRHAPIDRQSQLD
jgi:DNA-binding NarL/FixJ family response regulator